MPFTACSRLQIHYEVDGSGEPLVLLHGLMGSIGWWRAAGYVEALARDHQVVAIDARGHGKSEKPHDAASYVVTAMVDDVVAVLDECGIEGVSLCGWSLGGDTALAVAALRPDRAKAVIAIGAFGYGVGFADCPALPSEVVEAAVEGLAQTGTAPLEAELASQGGPQWAARVREADPVAMLARTRMLLAVPRLERRLHDLRAPLLLISGAREMRPRLPLPPQAESLVLAGEDHLGTFLRTDITVPAISRFLRASGAPSSTR